LNMTQKEKTAYLIDQLSRHTTHIKKIKKRRVIYTNGYWATSAYRYIYKHDHLFEVAGGMYMNGGGNTLYFC